MKRANFVLGLTILVVAVTLAMVILFKPRERGGSANQVRRGGTVFDDAAMRPKLPRPDGSGTSGGRVRVGVSSADPQFEERAKEVEAAALDRLRALTEQLDLTSDQQAQVFPLLARSTPQYDESLEIAGGASGGALTRRDAEAGIHEILDADQQGEMIESIAEKDLWWSEVISRLEEDLAQSTDPGDGSSPAAGTAPAEEAGVPSSHRGGNLFDRMNNEGR